MADLPLYSDSNGDTGVGPGRGSTTSAPPSTPRWVKLFGSIVLVLALLLVILHLAGGGLGPGSHIPSSSVTEQRAQQP